MIIGLVSPGKMGASVGAAAAGNDHQVIWAGDGRGAASHQRASDAGLEDCGSMTSVVNRSEVILSVCPPHDAENVGREVADAGFQGTFVDCNAIAPQRSRSLASLFSPGTFVDAGIIGGPAWSRESGTRLYLSGPGAADIANLFKDSPLEALVVSDQIGSASALKMVFAAYTKGSTALLTAILAVAEKEGVRAALESQWGNHFSTQTHHRVVTNSEKAWRFAGEMREIAATFESAGQPGGFHLAAAEVFESLSGFKDHPADSIEALLAVLTKPGHP